MNKGLIKDKDNVAEYKNLILERFGLVSYQVMGNLNLIDLLVYVPMLI